MSKKVLGIYEKDLEKLYCNLTKVEKHLTNFWDEPLSHHITRGQIQRFIKAKKDVSVRLASESVDLEALQKWCKIIPSKDLTQYEIGYKQALKDTLSWAEKEAKKK